MKESYTPEIFDKSILDDTLHIDDDDAFETTRQLARTEGLFVGMSSGAAMAAAIETAKVLGQGTVVVIFPDSGERYLSTDLFDVKRTMNLSLHNTLAKEVERFEPMGESKIGVYTCGPTVHCRLHLGQFRRYVFTDLLVRYLEYQDFDVNHVVNITDYDDKTITGAQAAGMSLEGFTQPFIDLFQKDLDRLSIRPAQAYPKVSGHFSEMTALVRTLLAGHHAYEKLHSVYFDIASLKTYGDLSNVDLDKIRLGATVDLDEYEKQNPRDFTLLKRVKLSELKQGVGIKTEWGNVRPSLHLQCAAISMTYLGAKFDIHTGSRELMFPHHENEIAIARAAAGTGLANVWIHCDPVRYDGSLGCDKIEDLTLDALAEQGWGMDVLRFWLMSAHYRKPLVLSKKSLDGAGATLSRINRCIQSLGAVGNQREAGPDFKTEVEQIAYDLRQSMIAAMSEDLKIPVMVSGLLSGIKQINRLLSGQKMDVDSASRLLGCFKDLDRILHLFDFNKKTEYSPEVQALLEERDAARRKKDWNTSDRLRRQIEKMGVPVHDKKV